MKLITQKDVEENFETIMKSFKDKPKLIEQCEYCDEIKESKNSKCGACGQRG